MNTHLMAQAFLLLVIDTQSFVSAALQNNAKMQQKWAAFWPPNKSIIADMVL